MASPKEITSKHAFDALESIDKHHVPDGNGSHKHDLDIQNDGKESTDSTMRETVDSRNQLWNSFLNEWPIERIEKLTIDEYSLGGKDSFCRWLEYNTAPLGGIGGSSAYKFGVYKRRPNAKNPVPKENDTTYASDGTYGWKKKYGTTANEAFQNIKTIILNIIDKAGSGDFDAIDKIDFESLAKWKIAFLYQPKDHPTLLPIYDAKRLCKLVDMPEDSPVSKLQEKLISQKPAEMGLLEYYVDLLQKRRDVFESATQSLSELTSNIEIDQHLESKVAADHLSEPSDQDNKPIPRNLIYFGAPGTGKSFKLNQDVETDFVDKNGATSRYERVTFYPTYSYAQFVGCYKPVMKPAAGGAEEIAYEFVPGPFLRVLVNALNEKPGEDGKKRDWCFVIEEINRANAAAVFGDVFQLLDRGSDGVSEYEVAASEDVKRFLQEKFKDCSPSKDDDPEESKKRNPLNFLKVAFKKDAKENDTKEWDSCRLRIPSNMYIWATMNSADQGVFPMDTAFKRRWEFEYIDIDNGEEDCNKWTVEWKGKGYSWNNLRKFINELLSSHRVNEDKLMGAHFVKPTNGPDRITSKSFESKVLMYLWEDAARMCRRQMFGDIGTYSALLEAWDKNGVGIFSNDPELKKLKDADDTKKIFAELLTAESTQPNPGEHTQPDDEQTSVPAP